MLKIPFFNSPWLLYLVRLQNTSRMDSVVPFQHVSARIISEMPWVSLIMFFLYEHGRFILIRFYGTQKSVLRSSENSTLVYLYTLKTPVFQARLHTHVELIKPESQDSDCGENGETGCTEEQSRVSCLPTLPSDSILFPSLSGSLTAEALKVQCVSHRLPDPDAKHASVPTASHTNHKQSAE